MLNFILNSINFIFGSHYSYFKYIENQAGVSKEQVGTIVIYDTYKGKKLVIYPKQLKQGNKYEYFNL